MILHKRVIITLQSGYTAVPKRGIRPVLSLGSPCSRTEKPVFLFFNQSGRIFRRKKYCCTPLRQFFLFMAMNSDDIYSQLTLFNNTLTGTFEYKIDRAA